MKLLIKVSFVSLVIMVFLISTAGAATFDIKRLLLYWAFDEGSGDTTKDLSGKGFDGKIMGKGIWVKEGVYKSAIQLQKIVVEAKGPIVANIKEISFGCWFYMNQHSTYNGLISINDGKDDCCDYRLMVDPAKSPFWNAGHHTDLNLDGKVTFDLKKWYHYVLVLDGKTDKVYVDGKFVGESAENFAPPAFKDVTFWLGTGEAVGTWIVEDSIFDDVFVTDKALTADEVNVIMKGNFMAVGAQDKLASTWAGLKAQ